MGSSKASLDWHGQPLLERVGGILGRCSLAPIVVVRSPGQLLPRLPETIEVVDDAHTGRGPLEGLATGLRAVEGRSPAAFVSSTDAPFLLPAFVEAVLATLDEHPDAEIAIPSAGGRLHPLAAAYRTAVRETAARLLAAGGARLLELVDVAPAHEIGETALRRVDPQLLSLRNLNEPDEYRSALSVPLPHVLVELPPPGSADAPRTIAVQAATLGAAASAAGVELDVDTTIELNGEPVRADRALPLVDGDSIVLTSHAPAGV
jgi:molybdopterin-guanine dinucleotide biosynthesis protein A